MKILVITSNPNPHRASFRQRIGVYLEALKAGGIECETARLPAGYLARRMLFKRAADFDGVFLHKKGLNPWDAFWLQKYSRKIIYDFDDAIMYNDKNSNVPSRKRLWSFRRTVKLADMVIAGNEYLADQARPFSSNVRVLPTGLKTSEYKITAAKPADGKVRLVWIGSSATLSYLEMLRPALEMLGQRHKNVVLRIIADAFFDMENMCVEKCHWSLEHQAELLMTSDIGLAPLPDNPFTRGKCGFKIIQYGAAGLPVAASPVGCNADYVLDGITGFLATKPSEWLEKVSMLVSDTRLRTKMGQQANVHVQKFDVSVIGKQLLELLRQCLEDVGK
jgi:glycosyltransferase involved in cell wall biosynthesis